MEFFIHIWIKDGEKRKILWHKTYPKQRREISCMYKDRLTDKKKIYPCCFNLYSAVLLN